ncbi:MULTISPECIES: DUF6907 domain-containing protein [Streptomyces]|uniref:Uncharacterized protein n=2 Tax=Streptomyces TaxID=1883 RepID=A0A2U9NZQ0_STRAS|nr:hypothetical protein [Streptomyces actuosus]AWT42829.1 hypothetical protein DMT42_11170 [Streptomyces actuosus]MBM4820060.1 hypothetical protein [Streptomyces actuosus]MBM4825058.1 hypothetical protein [Streptomyces actuosus]
MAQSAISQHIAALSGIPPQPTVAEQAPATVHPFPALKPGNRLVPALIGTRKSAHTAWIPCPTWCVERHHEQPTTLEDITHTSASEDVGISSFLKPDGSLLMYAMLQADPAASDPRLRKAHIGIEHEGMPDYLTPDMAEAFVRDLFAFGEAVLGLARAARLHNAATGDSDPDMDEALRRVRGGAA